MELKQSRSYQKHDLSKYFPQGRQRTKQTERQPRIVVDLRGRQGFIPPTPTSFFGTGAQVHTPTWGWGGWVWGVLSVGFCVLSVGSCVCPLVCVDLWPDSVEYPFRGGSTVLTARRGIVGNACTRFWALQRTKQKFFS
jgi:hypothetical protein